MARNKQRSNDRSRPDPRTVIRDSIRHRKRFTPDELGASLSERSEQVKGRSAVARDGFLSPQGLRVGACVVLLGLTGVFVAVGGSAQSGANDQIAGFEAERVEVAAEGDLAQTQASAVPDVEQARQTLSSAKEKGQAVATQQNAYLNTKPGETGEVTKISEQLAAILGDASEGSKGMDPKTPWYKTGPTVKAAPQGSGEYSWTFESTYEFSGDTAVVTWLCRHKETGDLLAWTMADYDGSDDTFSTFRSGLTSQGQTYIGGTEDKGSENTTPVDPDAPTIGPDDEIGTDGEAL